jgi:hypothetical protein
MTLVVLPKLYWIRNRAVNAWKCLEDPHLAQIVRRVEGGEMIIERLYVE